LSKKKKREGNDDEWGEAKKIRENWSATH
jgi:hypothetical protein